MGKNKINEYEAALRFNLSPTLLKWLTVHGVVDNTKLGYVIINELYYFDVNELEKINKKMEGTWLKTANGKRPTIPEGIKREIKAEAQFCCPVCHKSHGEVAHIDAVSATHCNHPKNLLYLCPSHHTEYDNALIPSDISRDEILIFKKSLLSFQRAIWKIQGETIKSYLSALNETRSLLSIHKKISGLVKDSVFKDTLSKIAALSGKPQSLNYTSVKDIGRLDADVNSYLQKNPANICPLCSGKGKTEFYETCPVCQGNGDIEARFLQHIDLSIYKLKKCKLCEGSGMHDDEDCIACEAKGKVSKYFYENHDWSMHDMVDCRLCKGQGLYLNEDCIACKAVGKVSKYFYDNHDWSMYKMVDCKLCDGCGLHLNEDCPACKAVGMVPQGFYDNHDWSMYDLMDCKLCKGRGQHLREDCPACNAEGKVSQHDYYNKDWSVYDLVECQLCKGTGRYHADDCVPCGAEGKVSRWFSDNHDWNIYRY